MVARPKGEIALAELDRLVDAGMRFGVVMADAGYGASAAFRQGLSERGLTWAVGIPRNQKIYGADIQLVPPTGRKRRPVPDQEPHEAAAVLAELPWRRVTWRHGTKGPFAARFAVTRIRVGDGEIWANNRDLPGDEVWLVGEWRSSGERKYYLSNLPPRTSLRALAAAIKARWVCEQGHQQLKQGRRHCLRRPGPLRGPVLDGPAPARADDPHGLCLAPAPPPRRAAPDGVGEKCHVVFRDRLHPRACRP
jgi:SRSO17 transposase